MRRRAIVTGGSGFVGANLARRLLDEGHEVHLLLRPEYAAWRLAGIRDDVRCYELDMNDSEELDRVVRSIGPDWVFHLAAYGAYSSQADMRQMVGTNILATMNLVTACLRVGFDVFVNAGSSSEYGFKDHPPAETEWLEPNSTYAVTKAAATHFCRFSAEAHGASVRTLRLYSVYGPYEEPTRLMPRLITEGLRGRLPVLASPDTARDYVHVDDVCTAFLLAATETCQDLGAVYNVGTGVQTSLRQLVDLARRVIGISAQPNWGSMPDRSWDTSSWVADSSKAARVLGWQPRYTLDAGFRATVRWFQEDSSMRDLYALAAVGPS